ncbi:MAG: C40 family peptidase [Litorimonas sp.]
MTDARTSIDPAFGAPISTRLVVSPFAPMVSEPNAQSAQKAELVHGQRFRVHARRGVWCYGQAVPLLETARPGYVGWVMEEKLGPTGAAPTHAVSSVSAPIFSKPDFKSHIVQSLPLGARVAVRSMSDAYAQIGAGAWLHRLHLRPLAEPESDLVAIARCFLGQPYVWGGNGARGIDCSGLVQMSLDACGIDSPRDADMQEAALGRPVARPQEPGDLLFWKGHVAMLTVPDRMIHANATHMAVVEEPLQPALERMGAEGLPLRAVRRL